MKRYISILVFLSFFAVIYSQNISVSSFKLLDTDLTANTTGTIEQDQNGETSALIKVVTTQTGFTFDGGALGIVKTVQKPSEIWVYVPKGLKKITISHPQLGILRDYYLNVPIEAARTYEMVLVSGEVQTIVKQTRTSQYVVFQLTPPDAVVELNGELLKTEGGVASKMMKFGTYNYRVQAPNYFLEAGSVTIDDPENKKVVNVSLKPNFALVTIKVENNAEIWVNGEKKGDGSWTGNLGAGTYELEARKEGHRSTLTTHDFEVSSEPQVVTLQTPIPIYSEIDINSSPGMAEIYIDGEKYGQTPQLISKIITGKHNITIEKKGFKKVEKKIEIQEGVVAEINITLEKEAIKEDANKSNTLEKHQAKGKTSNNKIDDLINKGRNSLNNRDPRGAKMYAEKADAAAKHKSAEAYILLGDIEATYGTDGGKAAGYYNQAINLAPNNPEGYKKWALVYRKKDLSLAVKKLEEMEHHCPNEDAKAIIAHIYMLEGDEKLAYENYAKADINRLDKGALNEYARCSYFTGHFDDAIRAAEAGIKLEPRDPVFNRLAMFSNYETKNFQAALYYLNKYFNETDGAKFSEYDHFYAALIYEALNDKNNMFDQYNKALALTNESSLIKRWAITKAIATSYLKDKDYENAIRYYKDYLNSKPEIDFEEEEGLASIYAKYGDANEAMKKELLSISVDLYHTLAQKYPNMQAYSTYMAASIMNKLDDNMSKSLAKPDYQKVIDLLKNKSFRHDGENTMLKTAYHYMMFNSYLNNSVSTAKDYANKILAIDPNYQPALQIKGLK